MSYYSGNLHEPTKAARIRLRIWGLDSNGQPFAESVLTRNIGRERAEVEGVKAPLRVGDVIGVANGDLKARFRVAVVEKKDTGDSSVDLVMIAPAAGNFWGVKLEALPEAVRGRERRSSPRYHCKGFALLQVPDQKFVVRAPITDIALNGCYIELAMPYATGCTFNLEITVREERIECPAQVVSSHPGVGMGVRFDSTRLIGTDRLRKILDQLDRELISKQPR
ncbi:MAG TPA: PilZ domain-containing protein [Terriglobales bacterium]